MALFQAEFLDKNSPKSARVHCTAEEEELEAEGDDPLYIFPPVPRPNTALWQVLGIIVQKLSLKFIH